MTKQEFIERLSAVKSFMGLPIGIQGKMAFTYAIQLAAQIEEPIECGFEFVHSDDPYVGYGFICKNCNDCLCVEIEDMPNYCKDCGAKTTKSGRNEKIQSNST